MVRKIGEELKNARLERGISLTWVQHETKIRSRYLEAIEAGDFSVIPGGDIYLKGFIRSYAQRDRHTCSTHYRTVRKLAG